jgi:hypothetical protein
MSMFGHVLSNSRFNYLSHAQKEIHYQRSGPFIFQATTGNGGTVERVSLAGSLIEFSFCLCARVNYGEISTEKCMAFCNRHQYKVCAQWCALCPFGALVGETKQRHFGGTGMGPENGCPVPRTIGLDSPILRLRFKFLISIPSQNPKYWNRIMRA